MCGPHAPLSAGLPVREHCVLSIPGQDALQPGPHPRTPAKAKLSWGGGTLYWWALLRKEKEKAV